ncbi:hypothetical protein M433DRAFT_150504 [Acidomyces richmondensis BFW]|nr:MAG: hypothetical protein FE78DRAFT_83805 [Acidomyces sp. 'richmondensis']KYG48972.1 hypothetical protein M433DRAFT_150504 [Acidomyces richmondensis BFW]
MPPCINFFRSAVLDTILRPTLRSHRSQWSTASCLLQRRHHSGVTDSAPDQNHIAVRPVNGTNTQSILDQHTRTESDRRHKQNGDGTVHGRTARSKSRRLPQSHGTRYTKRSLTDISSCQNQAPYALVKQSPSKQQHEMVARGTAVQAGRETEFIETAKAMQLWNVEMSQLRKHYDSNCPENGPDKSTRLGFENSATIWVASICEKHKDGRLNTPALSRLFADKTSGSEPGFWPSVALWLLRHEPHIAVDFLLSTHTSPYPPRECVQECLDSLWRHYINSLAIDQTQKQEQISKYINAVTVLVEREDGEQFVFDDAFFKFLVAHADESQMRLLWQKIKDGRFRSAGAAICHFAEWLAEGGQLEESLTALLDAHKAGASLNSPQFLSACAVLLRRSMKHSKNGGLRFCLRAVEMLVGVGLRLERHLCNVIMLNAVEAGDLDTAMAVHRSAIEQNLEPNKYTYAVLLKACQLDIRDGDRLRQTIKDAISSGTVRGNVVLSGLILHCLALHHVENNYHTAYSRVLEAYVQLCDPKPLERLGMPMPPDTTTSTSPDERRVPLTPHLLSILLTVLFFPKYTKVSQSLRLYQKWRELVEAGDPDFAPTAASPHVATAFLHQFCRRKHTLIYATRLIRDMQRALPPSAGVEQALPDVYTWSVFLDGFARNGEPKLAEQVLGYMRRKGVEPNVVTWTSLIGGAASNRDIGSMLDAVRKMDASGTAFNDRTYKAVGMLKESELAKFWEERRLEQSLDFTSDIIENLSEKSQGFYEARGIFTEPGIENNDTDQGADGADGLDRGSMRA